MALASEATTFAVPSPPAVAATHTLSEKTKTVAHPGDRWKAGYVTLSRVAKNKTGWRNVHVSKRSFEKLCENFEVIKEALANKTHYHLMLTKKQHILTTRFQPEGKPALLYVSILHPVQDTEELRPHDEVNHAKTINLSVEEFTKFTELHQQLLDVVKSKVAPTDNDESLNIDCFRWTSKENGQRSSKIFLTRQECSIDATHHYFEMNRDHFQGQPMEYDHESAYNFDSVEIPRPGKLEVIEHLAYAMVTQSLKAKGIEVEKSPPSEKDVLQAIEHFDLVFFKVLARKVLTKLSYKNLYLTGDFVGIFMYTVGLSKAHQCLVKHSQSCSGKLYTRLLDHCFEVVHKEMSKE